MAAATSGLVRKPFARRRVPRPSQVRRRCGVSGRPSRPGRPPHAWSRSRPVQPTVRAGLGGEARVGGGETLVREAPGRCARPAFCPGGQPPATPRPTPPVHGPRAYAVLPAGGTPGVASPGGDRWAPAPPGSACRTEGRDLSGDSRGFMV